MGKTKQRYKNSTRKKGKEEAIVGARTWNRRETAEVEIDKRERGKEWKVESVKGRKEVKKLNKEKGKEKQLWALKHETTGKRQKWKLIEETAEGE